AQCLKAILDGTIADGYRQMSFSSAGLAVKNQRTPLGNEVRPQIGTEQGLSQGALQTEVELVNRLQERKVCFARKALQAGLLAMRHLLGQQQCQKIAVAPVLFLRSIRDLLVDTTGVRQVQPSKQWL